MKVFNIRLGLATNSSSSHSMIFMKNLPNGRAPEWEHFGWDDFTLVSEASKLEYMCVALTSALEHGNYPDWLRDLILSDVLPDIRTDMDGIDHQSQWDLPRQYGTQFIDRDFLIDLREFLKRRDLVILGGNDNSDHHPLRDESAFTLPFTESVGDYVCRKDSHGYWVLFSPESGSKIRFSFNEANNSEFTPTKADAPELLDIKLSDYCPYNCQFCYQGSTSNGKHADYSDLWSILQSLSQLNVFEIALGGGEPTLYPRFIDVLHLSRSLGIVPNFTTRNLAWFNDENERQRILEYCGAFAFSALNAEEIIKLGKLVEYHNIASEHANIHIVMGTINKLTFGRMLEVANDYGLRCTLLGYKTDGRGAEFKPMEYSWWLKEIDKLRSKQKCPNISIDTALAAQYEQEILDSGIPKWLFHTLEGKFSAYIDAVNMTIAPSSYDRQEEHKLDEHNLTDSILSEFRKF